MLLLQSSDRFDEAVEFDPITSECRQVNISVGEGNARSRVNGFYSFLSGVFCALFCSNEQLFIQVGSDRIELVAGVRVMVMVAGETGFRTVSISVGEKMVVSLEYTSRWNPIEFDPTPNIEEEDFDFGVFLSDIAKDWHRQDRLKGILCSTSCAGRSDI